MGLVRGDRASPFFKYRKGSLMSNFWNVISFNFWRLLFPIFAPLF